MDIASLAEITVTELELSCRAVRVPVGQMLENEFNLFLAFTTSGAMLGKSLDMVFNGLTWCNAIAHASGIVSAVKIGTIAVLGTILQTLNPIGAICGALIGAILFFIRKIFSKIFRREYNIESW